MATKGTKAVNAADDAKARLAERAGKALEAVRTKGGAAESGEVSAVRSAVREAASSVTAGDKPAKKAAKKAVKRATKKAVAKTDDVETQIGSDDKALTTDPPAKGGMGLTLPEPGQTTRIKFPRAPDPIPPDPPPRGDLQGPPVADFLSDAQARGGDGPPQMSEAAAANLRKIMSTSKADAAREKSLAARQANRELEYPNRIAELRGLRQDVRTGNADMERMRRTQATLIAELRRRTEATRGGVQGPEVGDLAARPRRWFGGSSSRATNATQPPQGGERGRGLPQQYGLIRGLAKWTANRAGKALGGAAYHGARLVDDAKIVGGIGAAAYGLNAVGGTTGIGNFISYGDTRGPQQPAQQQQEQGQEGQPAKKPSYGEQFKQKARQSRQTPSGNSGTLQKLKKIRGEA